MKPIGLSSREETIKDAKEYQTAFENQIEWYKAAGGPTDKNAFKEMNEHTNKYTTAVKDLEASKNADQKKWNNAVKNTQNALEKLKEVVEYKRATKTVGRSDESEELYKNIGERVFKQGIVPQATKPELAQRESFTAAHYDLETKIHALKPGEPIKAKNADYKKAIEVLRKLAPTDPNWKTAASAVQKQYEALTAASAVQKQYEALKAACPDNSVNTTVQKTFMTLKTAENRINKLKDKVLPQNRPNPTGT